jgi:hypothetical protein
MHVRIKGTLFNMRNRHRVAQLKAYPFTINGNLLRKI